MLGPLYLSNKKRDKTKKIYQHSSEMFGNSKMFFNQKKQNLNHRVLMQLVIICTLYDSSLQRNYNIFAVSEYYLIMNHFKRFKI